MSNWDLKAVLPFAVLGVRCDSHAVIEAAYLPKSSPPLSPQNPLAKEADRQIRAYLRNPRRFAFELPLLSAPTAHQRRVRAAMEKIPPGETRTYGEIAKQINSSPRAVGGACRANILPLFVPCHRVVGACGVGGFMGGDGRHNLSVKQALLGLESA